MPFNFLKKSRHYNVTSKSLFVISVHHLLDTSTTVDCTLSSESTGQECLDNVCQRLSILQPEFFGLRYLVKGTKDELRWIDLERPLSRQLEKYAAGSKLYLRVMYYVMSGVTLLDDEVSRYYYFLQLKSDIVEGKISCDAKQAILLASYCRHAEYDGYQKDKHTIDYLKTILPFPKRLIEQGLEESLTEEVLKRNIGLQNLNQSAAEELYIVACQQLDGYGQEKFWAKDSSGNEVQLGITINGIAVTYSDNVKFYPWYEVQNVVNLKRTFNIEQSNQTVSFIFTDAETGRYFWKLCVLQHTFYTKYEQNQQNTSCQPNLFQNVPENLNDSREDLLAAVEQQQQQLHQQQQQHHQQQQLQRDIYQSDYQLTGNGIGNGSTSGIPNSVMSSSISLAQSQHQQQQQNLSWANIPQQQQNDFATPTNFVQPHIIDHIDNRVQSSSCLDLSNNNYSQERERLKALLPTYRPAPDYETAVQQKYMSGEPHLNTPPASALIQSGAIVESHLFSSSQPDMHNANGGTNNDPILAAAAVAAASVAASQQHRYPDVTQTSNTALHSQLNGSSNLTSMYANMDLSQRLQIMRLKPPPPYPANRLSSTSTPDLAVASHRTLLGYRGTYVSGSSPDLVSTRTFLNAQYLPYAMNPMGHSQPYLPHGTFENLNMIEEQPSDLIPLRYPMKKMSVPNELQHHQQQQPQPLYRHHQQQQQPQKQQFQGAADNTGLHKTTINGSVEPIYENVPLPWHGGTPEDPNEMRNRTSSIQSAPGGVRQEKQQSGGVFEHQNAIGNHKATIKIIAADETRFNNNNNNISNNNNNSTKNNSNIHQPVYHLSSNNMSSALYKEDQIKQQQHQTGASPKHHRFTPDDNNVTQQNISTSSSSSMAQNQSHSSSSIFGSSYCSSFLSSNVMNDSSNSSSTTATTKEKKKKRWGILGRHKSPSADKQKSATLGREKTKSKSKADEAAAREEANLRHRWSTGLPKFQSLSASFSKDKLCQILDTKLNDPQLFLEFERIPKRRDSARYECALMDENRSKNSDPNFLPYDDNRVRITPTMDNRLGYVNASHITSTVGNKQRFYIIAQSPFDKHTTNIFWQCVWEADVYLIVQLSDELNYIPPTTNRCLEFGQFQVYQEFSQPTDRCVTSKLRLYHTQSRRYRSVWHLSYSDWAEQNCPSDVNHFLEFLEELNSVRLASINEVPPGHNTNPPVLIHCREGGGRSGVTLTADLLLYTLDHNQDLDIPRVIGQLRHQRDSIIPSLAQYKFIYALLITYLKRTRLI